MRWVVLTVTNLVYVRASCDGDVSKWVGHSHSIETGNENITARIHMKDELVRNDQVLSHNRLTRTDHEKRGVTFAAKQQSGYTLQYYRAGILIKDIPVRLKINRAI